MSDEMDARLWNQNHEAFSADAAAALQRAAAKAGRFNRSVPMLKLMGAVLAASIFALGAPPPALAAQAVSAPAPSVEVPYQDLDLGNAAGRRLLAERIERAAKRLCQPQLVAPLKDRTERRVCIEAAIASADLQLAEAIAGRSERSRLLTLRAR